MNVTNQSTEFDKFVSYEEPKSVKFTLFVIGYLLQFITCVIGNGLELYILVRKKQHEDYITSALCALACCDFFQAFIVMPVNFSRINYLDGFLGDFLCRFAAYLKHVYRMSGIWITVYIAFDRYINVFHPLKFAGFKNKKVCRLSLTFIIIGNALLFLYIFPSMKVTYMICSQDEMDGHKMCEVCTFHPVLYSMFMQRIIINMIYTFLLPIIFLIYLNFFIIKTLLNFITFHTILMSSKFDNTKSTASSLTAGESSLAAMNNSSSQHRQPINIFTVKVVILLLFFFFITNFPIFLKGIIDVVFYAKYVDANSVRGIFSHLSIFIYTINCSLNPWIYCFYSKNVRKEVRKVFHKCSKKSNNNNKPRSLTYSLRKPSTAAILNLYIGEDDVIE